MPSITRLIKSAIATLLVAITTLPYSALADNTTITITRNSLGENFICAQRALAKAYEQLDIAVEYLVLPSKRSLTIANAGLADGEMLRVAGTDIQYPNLMQIPVPLCQLKSVMVANQRVKAQSFEQMRDYRLGITLGFVDHENMADKYQLNVVRVTQNDVLIDMLLKDRVDAIFLTESEAMQLISENEGNKLKILRSLDRDLMFYHYLHKKHHQLVPLITSQLRQLEHQGKIDRTAILKLPRRGHPNQMDVLATQKTTK
ncbi:substrate-binding periplasmic protein [Neiella marina]|nr:transporter substrate-binding domain-containing protein [Neiella marina]